MSARDRDPEEFRKALTNPAGDYLADPYRTLLAQLAGCSERRARFVHEYVECRSGTLAARRAGYSAKSAAKIASELLQVPAVRIAIDAGIAHANAWTGQIWREVRAEIEAQYAARKARARGRVSRAERLVRGDDYMPVVRYSGKVVKPRVKKSKKSTKRPSTTTP